jgi:hypothetical protein
VSGYPRRQAMVPLQRRKCLAVPFSVFDLSGAFMGLLRSHVQRECRGRDLAPGRDARFARSHCRAFESFSTIVEKRVYE